MGLINIDELLKIDRFRDLKEDDRVIKKGIIDEIIRMSYNYNRVEFNEYNAAKNKNIGECKPYLEELGYKVNTKSSTRHRNLNCYKIDRL